MENKKCIGTYLLHNKNTGEAYVGSGVLSRRKAAHEKLLKTNDHYNYKLQKAFNKDSNFDFVSVPTETIDEARDLEQSIINDYITSPLLLNISHDARYCNHGGPLSDEHKQKISQANTGRKHSPEAIEKMRLNKIGFKHSEDAKQKISLAGIGRIAKPETIAKMVENRTGKKHSKEWCENISKGNTGKKLSEERKAAIGKMSSERIRPEDEKEKHRIARLQYLAIPGNIEKISQALTGRPVSIETREKIRIGNTGKVKSEETKSKQRESVTKKLLIDNVIYNGLKEASEKLNISAITVFRHLEDKNRYPNWKRIEKI